RSPGSVGCALTSWVCASIASLSLPALNSSDALMVTPNRRLHRTWTPPATSAGERSGRAGPPRLPSRPTTLLFRQVRPGLGTEEVPGELNREPPRLALGALGPVLDLELTKREVDVLGGDLAQVDHVLD